MLYKPKSKKIAEFIEKYDKGKKVIFVSQAKENMCWARLNCKYVIEQGHVPVNYFTAFAHFVHEIADLETMIDSINSLIVRCDELWVFGNVSEGVWFEIKMCRQLGLPVKYFCIEKLPEKVKEITQGEVKYTKKFREKMNTENMFVEIVKL